MRSTANSLRAAILLSIIAIPSYAADVYVVQGRANGPLFFTDGKPTCEAILWNADVAFYNRGDQAAQVRVIDISNGASGSPAGETLDVPPHQAFSLVGKRPSWQNITADPLWVLHLDAPAELELQSVLWIGSSSQCTSVGTRPFRFGQVLLPVVHTLTPAQGEQVHLITGVGGDEFKGHLNVGIFNASELLATAHIEIRQHCNNATIDSRTVTVRPKSLVQFGGFSSQPLSSFLQPDRCQGPPFDGPLNSVYTVVTVDQPSFSFVSAVADNATPMASIGITW
ncbi:MAG: hypothetical protein QOK37_4518 [Thermoanaerobaculia bacterium]|jgi:hypothetical protein|nr:hypothetical protein [Thermoanaerobaculia bacterium]